MCLVRGFGKGIWGRAGIWGMEFYNSFVSLDEWIRCKLTRGNKHGVCEWQILGLNPIKIGVIW